MRNLLLSTALIIVPIGAVLGFHTMALPANAATAIVAQQESSLGDMSAFSAIVTDVQSIAATGDLAGAKARIKDLETAWDDGQPTLRPLSVETWGVIDGAADAALSALRASTPDAETVTTTLAALQDALANPLSATIGDVAVTLVSGIAVTGSDGRPLPCEDMLKAVVGGLASATLNATDRATVTDFQTKATERCNADDDARSDAFSAQALALLLPVSK